MKAHWIVIALMVILIGSLTVNAQDNAVGDTDEANCVPVPDPATNCAEVCTLDICTALSNCGLPEPGETPEQCVVGCTEACEYGCFSQDFVDCMDTAVTCPELGICMAMLILITPIELVSFEALELDREVLLKWTTATEKDNAGFNLHRAEVAEGVYQRINDSLTCFIHLPGTFFPSKCLIPQDKR